MIMSFVNFLYPFAPYSERNRVVVNTRLLRPEVPSQAHAYQYFDINMNTKLKRPHNYSKVYYPRARIINYFHLLVQYPNEDEFIQNAIQSRQTEFVVTCKEIIVFFNPRKMVVLS